MLFQYEYRGKGYEKKKKKKKKVTLEVEDDDQDKKSDGEDTVDGHDTAPETDKPETDADRSVGVWNVTTVFLCHTVSSLHCVSLHLIMYI